VLNVGHFAKPERNASKSRRRKEARSRDIKYTSDAITKVFKLLDLAEHNGRVFRRHAEKFVRGKRLRNGLSGRLLADLGEESERVQQEKRLSFHYNFTRKRKMLMVAVMVAAK